VRKKEATAENGEENDEEPPSFPLVDVPDADVSCGRKISANSLSSFSFV
jgi:hypothetical protein